jgi:hypothetical protein
MKNQASWAALSRLRKKKDKGFTPGDAMELLCQITFALLIIYVMLHALFKSESKAQVEELKGKLQYYKEKLDEITTTAPGKLYDEKEQALIDLQWQKLLNAMDKVEEADRKKMSMYAYVDTAPDGSKLFSAKKILTGDKIADPLFAEGMEFARENLPNQALMAKSWLERILALAGGMHLAGPGEIAESASIRELSVERMKSSFLKGSILG